MNRILLVTAITILVAPLASARPDAGPVRILFLGHEAKHHPSDDYYPMLAEALGRDAIYFDYHTSVEEALGDAEYLDHFDGVLLYANHDKIEAHQHRNLLQFVENGGGFIPVHCASYCFRNEPGFIRLCGGQFDHHKTGVFKAKIVAPEHPAMRGVTEFEAWDETYVHRNHGDDRTILMVREPAGEGDNIEQPEPWTWTRRQGKGRVFYTASGHDHRVWTVAGFHQLLQSGILWAVGDQRRASHEAFLAARPPLKYERRDNIPNYEKRPEPLLYQLPLSAGDSMSYTQAPAGFRLEMFAAEPDIVNPVCMAWDERGRLWVAETVDYPNEITADRKGNDSIKILEDTDGDGRCDKVTVFVDGLNVPTSLTLASGGVLVHQAPETLLFKDTDGDDRADTREVVITGWGTRDTHAGPSNLRYGLDNQIWGTVGYAAFNGTVGGEQLRFGMGVYRFAKDGGKMEFLHQYTNNTWGLGFNEAGDVFGSTANNQPSFFGGIPAGIYGESKGLTARMVADTPKFHPITPNIRQVDAFGAYTSAAGHAFANSDGFPESWRGRMAFVCGPTGHLLGKFAAERDGAGCRTRNAYALVPSADEWFSPVAAEVGPDGALWIADWYNFIIQHNPTPKPERGGYAAKTGKGNAHINPNRDRQHGRIYRLVWDKAPEPRIRSLAKAGTEELVSALADANQFWRLTAQRLLVDGRKLEAVEALRQLAGQPGIGAVHALWTLHGLGKLDADTHRGALLSADPVLRRNAVRALSHDSAGLALLFESGVINDPDLATRLSVFVALAQMPTSEPVRKAVTRLSRNEPNRSDEWLSSALTAAAGNHGVDGLGGGGAFVAGPNLLEDLEWEEHIYSGKADFATPESVRAEGGSAFRITSTEGADAGFRVSVGVKPNTRYLLAGKIRTKGVKGAMGALCNVHGSVGNQRVVTRALRGRNDWTEVRTEFNSRDRQRVLINALFGGWGRSTGIAWYDDISLHELVPAPERDVAGEPDAERGKAIFLTHPVAACNRCHQLGGVGGPIGPALDGIAARKDAAYLRQSLLDPNAAIAEGYPGTVSPMPPIKLLLNDREVEDVLAYLATLK